MSKIELNNKVKTYFELMAQIKELEEMAEAIKDAVKGAMVEQETEKLTGDGWSATWHNTKGSRFDSKRFKADHADLFGEYSIQTTGTRFTLQPVKGGV